MKMTFKDLLLQNKLGALADIPEGKHIGRSEEGQLELQDDLQPKPVTERIKTFYDAYSELPLYYPAQQKLIEEYDSVKRMEISDDIVAYMQLRIIICALNEGWTPQFTENERRWYPYFCLWTEDELKDKSDEWKDGHQLLLWGGCAYYGSYCGVACSTSGIVWSFPNALIGSRLAYKTEALATYAGRTFAPVYARFYIGDKAKDAMPWREFKAK
jgi:hypothetical protein